MKKSQTLTFLRKMYSFTILNAINVKMEITANPYGLPIDDLFTMAGRINKKRSFLFVSKVLGKHLPIEPQKGLLTAALLGARYAESVRGFVIPIKEELISSFFRNELPLRTSAFIGKDVNPLVIGFAETATALGHAFFDCFEAAEYFHTTREELDGITPSITFEEEHSHSTSHRCYIPINMIKNQREIILVDDEMTSGKTALNIIQSIHTQFPRREYTVVSILDWRSDENIREFAQLEKSLGITIHVVSLLTGKVQVNRLKEIGEQAVDGEHQQKLDFSFHELSLASFFKQSAFSARQSPIPFIRETGRFGIDSDANKVLHQKISEAAAFLSQNRTGDKTLCLGTGEFMYIPMKLAAEMGSNVFYQSTTRSPVYIQNVHGYGAKYGISYPNPEDLTVTHFVYNIPPGYYDELFIFFEREVDDQRLQPLLKQLETLQIKSIKLVFFAQK